MDFGNEHFATCFAGQVAGKGKKNRGIRQIKSG
jgi:hypothetical protein